MSQTCNYTFNFKFNNGGFYSPPFDDILKKDKYRKLCSLFDISDAVIVDELQPNTPEYWRYQYDRLFKIQDIIRNEVAQHGFDNQYVRDMQTNAHKLIDKLKNYEIQKTNS